MVTGLFTVLYLLHGNVTLSQIKLYCNCNENRKHYCHAPMILHHLIQIQLNLLVCVYTVYVHLSLFVTDLLPTTGGEKVTCTFLQELFNILIGYIFKSNERSSKVFQSTFFHRFLLFWATFFTYFTVSLLQCYYTFNEQCKAVTACI